ncbi:MAG: SRPBCC domain-containing protein [Xanthomonadales bacterium]|nr:SRPBCC domain-containing protein [Xanthomonadales bacterium]
MTKLPDLQETVVLAASQATAWKLLTDESYVPRWLGCMQYEARVGHVFFMQPDPDKRAAASIEGATHCEILALNEPDEFRFSWFLPGTPRTWVRFRLEAAGASETRVHFSHGGWDRFDAEQIRQIYDALAQGWTSAVLPNLVRLAEAEGGKVS